MWRHNSRRLSKSIVFAGSISINKDGIASNYSTISCRNFPHRQLKFAIGYNISLTAILRIHASAFNAQRPSGTYQSCQQWALHTAHALGVWSNRTRNLSQTKPGRALGRREGHTGVLGCRAELRALLRRAASKRGQKGMRWRSLTSLAGWEPQMFRTCAVRWI
jgi:hypothetical protein